MRKPCVVCGVEFDARGNTKTCDSICSLKRGSSQHYTSQQKWRAQHADTCRKKDRNRYFENREVRLAEAKARYWQNRERCLAKTKEWQAKNRQRVLDYQRRTAANHRAALKIVRELQSKGLEALL